MILNFSFYLACTGIHHFIKDISTEQLLLPQNFQLTFLSAKVSQTILKRAGMFGITDIHMQKINFHMICKILNNMVDHFIPQLIFIREIAVKGRTVDQCLF